MGYEVYITTIAKHQLDRHIAYILSKYKNLQAAREVISDANSTKKRLSMVAGSLPLCEDEVLARHGYRRIFFKKHALFMIYNIEDNIVYVQGIYHRLQDYESVFAQNMSLK